MQTPTIGQTPIIKVPQSRQPSRTLKIRSCTSSLFVRSEGVAEMHNPLL